METITEWQESADKHGLIETLSLFSNFVYEQSNRIVMPGGSFAHCVIDDYNLTDGDIDLCLANESVNSYLIEMLKSIDYQDGDCEKDTWESFAYWDLVDGTLLVIEFMNWLKTIPQEQRDVHWNRYHGLPDYATEEDYRKYWSVPAGYVCPVVVQVRYSECKPL